MRTVVASAPVTARISAFAVPIAAGAIFGIALACLIAPIRWDDQSFYLYAAPRLLDGYRLYSADLQDTNPPLIAWSMLMPAAFSRLAGITVEQSFVLFIGLLAGGALAWSHRLATGAPPGGSPVLFRASLAVVLVYVTIVLPSVAWKLQDAASALGMGLRYDYGQREHILTLLTLPYVFAAARRLDGARLHSFEAVLLGIVAAVGLSLKPQYLTVVFAVETWLFWRGHTIRQFIRPELIALGVTGIAYCFLVWVITPQYFTTVIPTVAAVYGDFSHKTATEIMMTSKYNFAVVAAAMAAFLLLRSSKVKDLAGTFLAAGTGAFVAFLLQGKGWSDHLLPAEAFILIALAIGLICRFLPHIANAEALAIGPAALVTAAICCIAALAFYYPARSMLWAKSEYADQIAQFNSATAAFGPGTAFVSLTDGIYSQFDIALDRNFTWASRYPFLLLPPDVIAGDTARSAGGRAYMMAPQILDASGGTRIDARSYGDTLRRHVAEDFERWQPALVLVQRCEAPQTEPCTFGSGFRVTDWLSVNPEFASLWSKYSFASRVERFDLYIRTEAAAR